MAMVITCLPIVVAPFCIQAAAVGKRNGSYRSTCECGEDEDECP
jgi:hypothetical protein